jgi:CBS domain-containing protein
VQNLVGTEDMLRRLSLISVGSLLGVRDGDGGLPPVRATPELATIGPDEDLRGALSILLRSGAEELAVIGKDGEALGRVSFGDMRAAVAELSANVRG